MILKLEIYHCEQNTETALDTKHIDKLDKE